eukprot:s468_g12.t1
MIRNKIRSTCEDISKTNAAPLQPALWHLRSIDGKTAAVLTLGRGDANLAAAELYRRLGFQQMPEELFVDTEDDDGHAPRWVDPRHVLVLWDIRQGLRSLTLQEVSGAAKGTVVPQLEGDKEELQRMDSSHCAEVVERLTDGKTNRASLPPLVRPWCTARWVCQKVLLRDDPLAVR